MDFGILDNLFILVEKIENDFIKVVWSVSGRDHVIVEFNIY
jgi:hypothetical protein